MSYRIVLDTNVVVSALRSNQGASFKLPSLVGRGQFEFSLSVPLVFEYEDACKRQEKMSALMTQEYLEQRAARASREKFESALTRVPAIAPDEQDKF